MRTKNNWLKAVESLQDKKGVYMVPKKGSALYKEAKKIQASLDKKDGKKA